MSHRKIAAVACAFYAIAWRDRGSFEADRRAANIEAANDADDSPPPFDIEDLDARLRRKGD